MTTKQVVFQAHWFLGITAGVILAVMGLTGAVYSFQAEILRLINSERAYVPVRSAERLALPELVRRIGAGEHRQVVRIDVPLRGNLAGQVTLRPATSQGTPSKQYYDPYTGELLGEIRGEKFFAVMLDLHRYLAMGDVGKAISGACTLGLVFFCLSGLYLRWPRDASKWRAWLTLDWLRKGRSFNWDLHAVAGTWCLLFYLLFALTGLWWSYDWYGRMLESVFGSEAPVSTATAASGGSSEVDYGQVWRGIRSAVDPDVERLYIRFPGEAGKPVTVSYAPTDVPMGIFNGLRLEPGSGAVLLHEKYAAKPPGEKLLDSLYSLHVGEFFALPGRIVLTAASLAMPLFLVTGWLLYLDRRRKKRLIRESRSAVTASDGASRWLIGFASQSGFAEQLAWQTAGQLQAAGHAVAVESFARLDEARLKQSDQALFVVSTFGDGQPPDSARAFERKILSSTPDLGSLRYGLLALGDQQYQQFCGFARRVNHWLHNGGAQALFAPVEVDNADPGALRRWQEQLAALTGIQPASEARTFGRWRLERRELLNPGSQGGAVYLVSLTPEQAVTWQAGDILEVWPGDDAGRPGEPARDAIREYSIASLPGDGTVDLVIRQTTRPDGSLGLGSGWLVRHVALHGIVHAKVRRNSAFHAPDDGRPVILIGNGTGLAGLRSIIKARIAGGHHRNWLLYGERNERHDFLFRAEIESWVSSGGLARLDMAFSRDQEHKRYVQDLLRERADEVRSWVDAGASIYVCGSLEGMAAGVDEALQAILGEQAVTAVLEEGRYRRDVY